MSIVIIEPLFLLQQAASSRGSTNFYGLYDTATPDNSTHAAWSYLNQAKVNSFFVTGHGYKSVSWCIFGARKTHSPLSTLLFGLYDTATPDNSTHVSWLTLKEDNVNCLPLGGLFNPLIVNVDQDDQNSNTNALFL